MADITRLAASASPAEVMRAFSEDGAVIIKNVLTDDQLNIAHSELQPFVEQTPDGRNEFSGFSTQRVGALIARSKLARELARHPVVINACEEVLKQFADGYQLHFTQAVNIGPGETAQALHRDRNLWGGYIPRSIETQVSTIWAISDFTKANGATQVVPGSQTWEEERQAEPHEVISAEMPAGSLLLYSGSVIHGGGENSTSNEHRTALLIHYTLNWLRQEENQYLSCPPEVAKELSQELRALIGYSRGNGVLGFYSSPTPAGVRGVELADPKKLFEV